MLKNLDYPEYSLVIQIVTPLADPTQTSELLYGLSRLMDVVCTHGRNAQTVSLPHTMSIYQITCPEAGIPIHMQQNILASTLKSIILGQSVYGNAAINGQIQDRSGKPIGELISTVIPAPPTVHRDWPSRVLYATVPDSQGLRLRAERLGPAVDNWDRFWFLTLCNQGKSELLHDVNLHDNMQSFRLVYQYQGASFRFKPFSPLARRPTWATFVKVIDTLRDAVLQPYVAHDLQFNLVDGDGIPLGVGFLEAYKEAGSDAIVLFGKANSTFAFRMSGLDRANMLSLILYRGK